MRIWFGRKRLGPSGYHSVQGLVGGSTIGIRSDIDAALDGYIVSVAINTDPDRDNRRCYPMQVEL